VQIAGYKTASQVLIGGKTAELVRKGTVWSATATTRNERLEGGIVIGAGDLADALLVSRHRTDKLFFQISDMAAQKPAARVAAGRLRIYWDRSLSRRDDLLAQEIGLLADYVDAARPAAIDLVTFAGDAPQVTTLIGSRALREALGKVIYRGGTRLAALDELPLASADQCLMFSDGQLTVDNDADFQPDCRLLIVASAHEANGLRLGALAQLSRGQLLRLTANNSAQLLNRLLKPAVAVVAVRDAAGQRVPFRALPAPDGGWFVVGEMPESGVVQLSIAGLRQGLVERRYSADARRLADADAPAVLWASARVAELADKVLSHERMVSLAREFQVASPTMAFLVLETPEQYLTADIRPPSGFSKEWLGEYRQAKRERDAQRDSAKAERFSFVLAQWQARKQWWNTRFTTQSRQKISAGNARASRNAPVMIAQAAAPPPAPRSVAPMEDARSSAAGAELQEVVMTAQRVTHGVQSKTIQLDLADLLADQPYLKALDAAPVAQRLAVLAAQEKQFGSLPAFYLETSEWFRLKGDARTAEALLYSALELPVADDETRQIVAFRLQRDGQLDRAIGMLERIAVTTDFRPQPKRALALALAERGRTKGVGGRADLERAFTLLTAVALDPAVGDFDGIETVALMEANALVPAIDAAGGTWTLDPRLVALLDTDVRIVIEWTADDADIDLWVIEPNGEKVFYGDKTSSSGGQISNDMTDGYGPEEYAIRRAPAGGYEIRINGYDADRLNPNGNGRVMVRMIRDFGRATARETLVDADLAFEKGADRNAAGGLLIARMKVEGVQKRP
jgi:hypothetical protein